MCAKVSAGGDDIHPGQPRREAILQAEIWLALWQACDTHCLDIDRLEVTVRGCEVWLSGSVEDDNQLHLAECLVKGVVSADCCRISLTINHEPKRAQLRRGELNA